MSIGWNKKLTEMDACFYFKKRLCEDKRFSVTVLHVIHAINNSETILRLLFFIHGQTLCCFVCFPLCLEHPCNFALGLPLPVALEVSWTSFPCNCQQKCDCTGLGGENFETKLLCCHCTARFRQWNVFLLNTALKLFFSTANLDTHPINRIRVWHDAMVFAPRWSL